MFAFQHAQKCLASSRVKEKVSTSSLRLRKLNSIQESSSCTLLTAFAADAAAVVAGAVVAAANIALTTHAIVAHKGHGDVNKGNGLSSKSLTMLVNECEC